MTLNEAIDAASSDAAGNFNFKSDAPLGAVLTAAVDSALPTGADLNRIVDEIMDADPDAVSGVIVDYVRVRVRANAAQKILTSIQKAFG